MIPYGRQSISEEDIASVVEVLRSDYLTQGPAIPAFEQAIVSYCGAQHAVAVNSATSALHLACLALGVAKGDRVWTSPNTFVASANCALYCEAQVDFVDIDPASYNMSVDQLSEKLAQAEKIGCLPKVVIPVHHSGRSCDMKRISELGKKYGFKIIEDASHAIGGKYGGEAVGNCHYSDITVFSFHPVKIITTGEGGVATTNQPDMARKMELLRSHGITRNEAEMTQESEGTWYYQQTDLGFNYRMTDMQAALGRSQMDRLNEFVSRRHEIAERYQTLLSGTPVTLPGVSGESYSAWHLFAVRLQLGAINRTHREVFDAMRQAGIGVNIHYIPVYLQPYYQRMGFRKGYCPESEKYYAEAISLPMYAGLTDSQQDRVVSALEEACGCA